jgi:hypothetical protein
MYQLCLWFHVANCHGRQGISDPSGKNLGMKCHMRGTIVFVGSLGTSLKACLLWKMVSALISIDSNQPAFGRAFRHTTYLVVGGFEFLLHVKLGGVHPRVLIVDFSSQWTCHVVDHGIKGVKCLVVRRGLVFQVQVKENIEECLLS